MRKTPPPPRTLPGKLKKGGGSFFPRQNPFYPGGKSTSRVFLGEKVTGEGNTVLGGGNSGDYGKSLQDLNAVSTLGNSYWRQSYQHDEVGFQG